MQKKANYENVLAHVNLFSDSHKIIRDYIGDEWCYYNEIMLDGIAYSLTFATNSIVIIGSKKKIFYFDIDFWSIYSVDAPTFNKLIYSLDGNYYCHIYSNNIYHDSTKKNFHTLKVYNISAKKIIFEYSDSVRTMNATFSTDSQYLIMNKDDCLQSIYSLSTGQLIKDDINYTDINPRTICIEPSSNRLLYLNCYGSIAFCDLPIGNISRVLNYHNYPSIKIDNIYSFACSYDGNYLATGDLYKIYIIELKSLKCLQILTHKDRGPDYLNFSPDNKYLVAIEKGEKLIVFKNKRYILGEESNNFVDPSNIKSINDNIQGNKCCIIL